MMLKFEEFADYEQDKQARILCDIWEQAKCGLEKFGKFRNAHEGYAVLLEEVDELWEEVKKNQFKHPERNALIQKEAIQVAAMALRIAIETEGLDL